MKNKVIILIIISFLSLSAFPAFASAATVQYTYDDTGQVTTTTYDDATRIEYTYDNSGNRTSKSTCASARLMRSGSVYGNYSGLQAAYDAAIDGDTIQSRAVRLTENLNVNRNITLTLEGGYDCAYTTNTGNTTSIKGQIRTYTGGGKLTIKNFVLEK